jgi:hypothetical protein
VIKGKWIIIGVLAIAIAMGFASWPLLKLRRDGEIYRTREILRALDAHCSKYQADHRRAPENLQALRLFPEFLLDGWRRPVQYRVRDAKSWDLWSLGPDGKPGADDINLERRPEPP